MQSIKSRYHDNQEKIAQAEHAAGRDPSEITLLLVSKQATAEQIQSLIDVGQFQFGENRLDHLEQVVQQVQSHKPLTWHFIGHLQRRKVAKVIQYCDWVQSLDSIALAEKIQKEAALQNKVIQVLLQVNISGEQQKTGLAIDQVPALVTVVATMSNLCCRGLMCMAPLSSDPETARPVFEAARNLFDGIKAEGIVGDQFDILSMGMSGDFEVAIACGATMVRIGSAIVKA